MRFRFSTLAASELKNAALAYEEKRPGLGADFRREVTRSLSWLVLYPKSAPALDADLRRKPVARFPFAIVYSVQQDRIVVTALVPTRTDPARQLGGSRSAKPSTLLD